MLLLTAKTLIEHSQDLDVLSHLHTLKQSLHLIEELINICELTFCDTLQVLSVDQSPLLYLLKRWTITVDD